MALKINVFLIISCLTISSFAQKTKVSGIVIDEVNGEALPFVNLLFKGTKIGTSTDIDGKFSLESYYSSDSLVITFVGYERKVIHIKKDISQIVTINLLESSTHLIELVVTPSETNPAHPIIKQVLANKRINNREKLDSYQYEVYNKIQLDINNITEEFKQSKAFKKFDFIFNNIDTSKTKDALPFFLTESISDYYYIKNPKSHKEVIQASNVSGIENKSVAQFTGEMYQQVNIYDNNVPVFGKNFVSPISNRCLNFYKYYLIDSLNIGGYWCYKLQFLPKRKGELTFNGSIWIHDTTYAVKMVEASTSENANINFVNELNLTQTFSQVEKEVWMLTKDELFVDFQWLENALGFYGQKTTTYKKFKINSPKQQPFYSGIENVFVNDSANNRSSYYWHTKRHEDLTSEQENIFAMIDTLQSLPIIRTYVDIIQVIASGYKIIGKVELGEYTSLYSFNEVEGHRFRTTIRTSNDFSKMIELSAFSAYGLLDENFKYGFGTRFFITKKPRRMVKIVHKYDVEQIGISSNAFNNTGVISSVFRRNPLNKLVFNKETRFSYSKEWFQGLTTTFLFRNTILNPLGIVTFSKIDTNNNLVNINSITASEASFNVRFAYNEEFLDGEFERISLGTKYPVLELNYAYGIPDLFASTLEYHRLKLSYSHKIRLGIIGTMKYKFSAGKIWGNLPYPLLEVHPGNETWSYNDDSYNMMNIGEFVSDEFISFKAYQHFDGLFLNKIPILSKLKWREVIGIKGVWGRLNSKHDEIMILSDFSSSLKSRPYLEGSAGIENIFKFLRLDVIWRLSHLDNELSGQRVSPIGFRAKLQFDF